MHHILMGLEDFFPLLIFFLIWWVSSRRRRKKKKAAPSPRPPGRQAAPPGGEQRETVNPLDVLRQMLFGDMELPPASETPARPAGPMPPGYEEMEWEEEHAREAAAPDEVVSVSVREEGEMFPEQRETPIEPAPRPRRKPKGKAYGMEHASRRALRRAVLWSEILGPPKGWRERPR